MKSPKTKAVKAWCVLTAEGKLVSSTVSSSRDESWMKLCESSLALAMKFDLEKEGWRVVRVEVKIV